MTQARAASQRPGLPDELARREEQRVEIALCGRAGERADDRRERRGTTARERVFAALSGLGGQFTRLPSRSAVRSSVSTSALDQLRLVLAAL